MIILLHILYSYTEYLWSYIVNRNSNPNSNVLTELCENEPNVSTNEYDRNIDYGALRQSRRFSTPPSDFTAENHVEPTSSDRFHPPEVEEFEHAVYDFDTKKIRFYPPVYVQRYITVVNILNDPRWKSEIKKVVDFGGSELGFFQFLKEIDGLEKIYEVDIDESVLEQYSYRIQPWFSDYMKDRRTPLEVKLLCGNASRPDWHLEKTDAVTAIELIEHMYPDDLDNLPHNIFGLVKPRIAVFTTPNEEFNVLFDNFNGFRHYDHKFEWTREEFESWATNICTRYPDYEVNFVGIGPGPKGQEQLGSCSQGAVFVRKSLADLSESPPLSSYNEYKVIAEADFPYYKETRTETRIIYDEAMQYISRCRNKYDFYINDQIEIPLSVILLRVPSCKSLELLRKALEEESNYEIKTAEDGDLILIVPEESVCSYDSDQDLKESDQIIEYVSASNCPEDDWDKVSQNGVDWDLNVTGNENNILKLESDKFKVVKDNAEENIGDSILTVSSVMCCSVGGHSEINSDEPKNKFNRGESYHNSRPSVKFSLNNEFPNLRKCLLQCEEALDVGNAYVPEHVIDNVVYDHTFRSETLNFDTKGFDTDINPRTEELIKPKEGIKCVNSSSYTVCNDHANEMNLENEVCSINDQTNEDLTIDSAYDLDECIESVQMKMKSLECHEPESKEEVKRGDCVNDLLQEDKKLVQNGSLERDSVVNAIKRNESFTVCNHRRHESGDKSDSLTFDKQVTLDSIKSTCALQRDVKNVSSLESSSWSSVGTTTSGCSNPTETTKKHGEDSACSKVEMQENEPLKDMAYADVTLSLGSHGTVVTDLRCPKSYDFTDKYLEYFTNCLSISSDSLNSYSDKKLASDKLFAECDANRCRNGTLCGAMVSSFHSDKFLYTNQSEEKLLETHNYTFNCANNLKFKSENDFNSDFKKVHSAGNAEVNKSNVEEAREVDFNMDAVKGMGKIFKSRTIGYMNEYQSNYQEPFTKEDTSDQKRKGESEHLLDAEEDSEVLRYAKEIDECLNEFLHAGKIERQDSCSPDKAADSGYPNSSNSGHDIMEMDLTPEQVKEIMTESESSLDNTPVDSPVAEDNRVVNALMHPPVIHLGDNVENGDVANNNRDGEGNNMMGQAVGEELEFHAVVDEEQDVMLMAAAGQYETNEVEKIESPNRCNYVASQDDSTLGSSYSNTCTTKNSSETPKETKQFVDMPSSLDSTSEMSCSCPESTSKLSTEDETDMRSVSLNNLKFLESFQMESCTVKDLKRYEAWLADKSCNACVIPSSIAMNDSSLYTDSTPSCSSDMTPTHLSISQSLPQYLATSQTNQIESVDAIGNMLDQQLTITDSNIPTSVFDEALDSLIREIVEDLLTPTVEPLADWLLQIQEVVYDELAENSNDIRPSISQALQFNESNEDLNTEESGTEYIVEADVKAGGDNSPDQ